MDTLLLAEIKKSIKKVNCPREHKIKNSLGVYDAYKYIRKNKWFDIGRPLKEKEFYLIIRLINKEIAQYLSNGHFIKLPCRMGILELRKRPVISKIKNSKLYTNLPVDWNRTLELWILDEEARSNKTLVRQEVDNVWIVHYDRVKANYKNKTYYEFYPNRDIKHKMAYNIKYNNLDSFTLY